MDFQFPNAIRFNGAYRDLDIDQPQTIGIGVANRSLMGGDLLIAANVYYKLWDDAALWQDVFVNQWAFAVGTQLTCGQCKYRLGYAYNTSPINHSVGGSLDGNPVGQDIVQLFQAACVPCVNQNRITFGVGARVSWCRTSTWTSSPASSPSNRASSAPRGSVAGHLLRRHGFDLAVRRVSVVGAVCRSHRTRRVTTRVSVTRRVTIAPHTACAAYWFHRTRRVPSPVSRTRRVRSLSSLRCAACPSHRTRRVRRTDFTAHGVCPPQYPAHAVCGAFLAFVAPHADHTAHGVCGVPISRHTACAAYAPVT